MRVIVAGAVAWTDAEPIRAALARLPATAVIVHGDCAGVDALAGQVARELGLAVERWVKNRDDVARHGKKLAWKGLNERMLASGAVLILAFHPTIEESRGTGHLIELARAAGVEVIIHAGAATGD
jgi:hypothetical protein